MFDAWYFIQIGTGHEFGGLVGKYYVYCRLFIRINIQKSEVRRIDSTNKKVEIIVLHSKYLSSTKTPI